MKRAMLSVVGACVAAVGAPLVSWAAEPRPIPVLAWNIKELNQDQPIAVSPYRNITMMFRLTTGNMENPARVKKLLDEQPEGLRAIRDWDVHRIMFQHPDDKLTTESGEKFTALWWDRGLEEAEARYDKFFSEYKALGGKLDYLILDVEHSVGSDIKTPEQWEAVAKDPRFPAFLKTIGYKSVKEISEVKRPFACWQYGKHLAGEYQNRLYRVVAKYFPDVKCSDYSGSYNRLHDLVAWGHHEQIPGVPGEFGHHVGTHQSFNVYGIITYLGGLEIEGRKFGYGPYRSLMYAANNARARILSSDVPIMPWIAWRNYVSDWVKKDNPPPYSSVGKTDYYQEVVFHTALCDPDVFLLWSAFRWSPKQEASDWAMESDLEFTDELFDQINELVGYDDRETLVDELSDWYAPFLLSGAIANGQSVWRLTPDPEQSEVALDQIKVNDDPLTFKVGNCTIVMKGGKVHEPEKPLSSVGYWIVGPKDLKPRIIQN